MPIFVNTLVITAEVASPSAAAPAAPGSRAAPGVAGAGPDIDRLTEEITAAVMRRVELALDRLTER